MGSRAVVGHLQAKAQLNVGFRHGLPICHPLLLQ